MTLAELIIELAVKFPKFEEGLEKAALAVEQRLLDLKKSADQLRDLDQAVAPLTSALLRVGAAGGAVTGALFLLAKGADDSAERMEKLRLAVEASKEALDFRKLVESARAIAALGQASNASAVEMQRIMVSAGLTQEQIDALTPRILDFAKVTGVDAESAARLLSRSLVTSSAVLKRYLAGINQTIHPMREFDLWLKEIDRATGRAAQGKQNLGEALRSLANAFGSLRAAVGGPLVSDLTALVSWLASAVRWVAALAREERETVAAIMRFVGTLGAAAVALGALAGAIKTTTFLLGTLTLAVKGLGVLFAAPLFVKAVVVIGAIAASFLILKRAAEAVANIFLSIVERLGIMTRRKREAIAAAERQAEAERNLGKAVGERAQKLEDIEELHKNLSAQAALRAEKEKAAAYESAQAELAAASQTEEGLRAIQGRLNERLLEGDRRRIREQIALNEQAMESLRRSWEAGEIGPEAYHNRVRELETDTARLRASLAQTFIEEQTRFHEARLAQEKELEQARVRLLEQAGQARLSVLQARADAELALDRQVAELKQQRAEETLAAFKRAEELRIAMIRRAADEEIAARRRALSIQESLLQLQQAREERMLERRSRALEELVKQGFFTETEAREIAAAEAEAIHRRRVQREIELEKQRLEVTLAGIEREGEVARQEAASKIAILESETRAKKASIELSARLRKHEADMSLALSRLETETRIREIQARTHAELKAQKAVLAGKFAARQIDAAAFQAGMEAIDKILAGSEAQIEAMRKIMETRQQMTEQQKQLVDVSTKEAVAAADAELRDRRVAIAQELAATLRRLEGERVQAATEGAVKIEQLQMSIAKQHGLSMEELVNAARRGMATLRGQWQNFEEAALGAVASVEKRFKDWWESIKGSVGTAKDLGKALEDLSRIEPPKEWREGEEEVWLPSPKERRISLAPRAPTPAPAPTSVAPPAPAQFTQTINVEGTQVRLDADKQKLFQDLLKMLMGPEGAKAFEEFMRRQAGPHAKTA